MTCNISVVDDKTDLLQVVVDRLVASCCRQTCCKLLSTDLLQVVVDRLVASCCRQTCCKLLSTDLLQVVVDRLVVSCQLLKERDVSKYIN